MFIIPFGFAFAFFVYKSAWKGKTRMQGELLRGKNHKAKPKISLAIFTVRRKVGGSSFSNSG